ncbi:MAG: hypothetical protein AUG85_05410 [Gemmatimonadetes bacterium 13_1_20CM_4_66_11]|nr:MAG: hypothetical protein AUI86_11890 [Gemmatimonadetes bacterium 13_1_40CM_3_66_12]OLD88139.1 MAG: hypothetical protein AUG85_05410 [Gemmatimonadetes bacterium 13_1_20CM_4_66_11]
MATIFGWYKQRFGRNVVKAPLSTSWSGRSIGGAEEGPQVCLHAMERNEQGDVVRRIKIEVPYDEAKRIIEHWQGYMTDHPANGGTGVVDSSS